MLSQTIDFSNFKKPVLVALSNYATSKNVDQLKNDLLRVERDIKNLLPTHYATCRTLRIQLFGSLMFWDSINTLIKGLTTDFIKIDYNIKIYKTILLENIEIKLDHKN